MLKINKYLKEITKYRGIITVRHKGCKSEQKCSPPIDCNNYECQRYKKPDPQWVPPTHPFFKDTSHYNPNIWRNLFFFVCLPAILGVGFHCFLVEKKEMRPKYVEFSYLRIRNKPFPWHPNRTLFHNPCHNALPGGYEVDVPEDEEYDPFIRQKRV